MHHMPSTALRQSFWCNESRPQRIVWSPLLPLKPRMTKPTNWARAWPTGCMRKTLESMVARDCVLDYSEVMTALRGYSALMPTPMTKRHQIKRPRKDKSS